MSPAERLALIRARVRHSGLVPMLDPTGVHRTAHPELGKRIKHRIVPPSRGIWRDGGYGVSVHKQDQRKAWVKEPDVPSVVHCAVKRTKKINPLTVIAKKWEDPETFSPRA